MTLLAAAILVVALVVALVIGTTEQASSSVPSRAVERQQARADVVVLHRQASRAKVQVGAVQGPFATACGRGLSYDLFMFSIAVHDRADVRQVVRQVAAGAPSPFRRSPGPLPELVAKGWSLRFSGPTDPKAYVSVSTPCRKSGPVTPPR